MTKCVTKIATIQKKLFVAANRNLHNMTMGMRHFISLNGKRKKQKYRLCYFWINVDLKLNYNA